MSPIVWLNELGSPLSPIVAAVLWQSTLLAIAIGLVCRVLPRSWPNVRFWIWQLVAIKLLLMPFWSAELAVPSSIMRAAPSAIQPVEGDGLTELVSLAPSRPDDDQLANDSRRSANTSSREFYWQGWFVVIWLAGLVAGMTRLLLARIRLARLLTKTTAASADLVAAAARVSERIGLHQAFEVRLSDGRIGPFVCGWLRRRLVLPRSLTLALDRDQLDQVLAHELAHLKRRDLIWGWLPEVARLVYWFHPVAHWTVRQVRLERELACDQVVMVALGHSAPAYAETLVRVVSLFSSPARLSNTVAGLHGEAVSSCGGLDSKEVRP